jgi:hypothetical protein
MATFWGILLSKWLLLLMLLIAHPVKRAVQRMPDSRIKRFLLISWN